MPLLASILWQYLIKKRPNEIIAIVDICYILVYRLVCCLMEVGFMVTFWLNTVWSNSTWFREICQEIYASMLGCQLLPRLRSWRWLKLNIYIILNHFFLYIIYFISVSGLCTIYIMYMYMAKHTPMQCSLESFLDHVYQHD